jgi:hypothetical protein
MFRMCVDNSAICARCAESVFERANICSWRFLAVESSNDGADDERDGGGREGGAIGVAARWEAGLNSRGGVLARIDICDEIEETDGRRGSGMLGGGERGGVRGDPEFEAGVEGASSVDNSGGAGCPEGGGMMRGPEGSLYADLGGAVEIDEAD